MKNFSRFVAIPVVLFVLLAVSVFFDSQNVNVPLQTAAAVTTHSSIPAPSITASGAIIYDVSTGSVLYAKNESAQLPLASITKLMTAAVVRQTFALNDIVAISPTSLSRDGDSGLLAGQLWSVENLLDLTLVESSNDGAQALADAASPFIQKTYPAAPHSESFVWRMNDLAQTLGLSQTYYLDATGLDVSNSMASAYGSALDVARLIAYIVHSYPDLLPATAEHTIVVHDAGGTEYVVHNTDEVVDIANLMGGKTGYTDLAGGNLAIVFDAGIGHPVIVVALHSTKDGRFDDVRVLTEYARARMAEVR